jgi:hypothetical protein
MAKLCVFCGDDSGMHSKPSTRHSPEPAPLQVVLIGYGGAGRVAAQAPGNYLAYDAQLRDHLWGLAPEPGVTAAQVHALMQLLVLGAQSAASGRFAALPAALH